MLTELLGKHMARARPDTVRVRHFTSILQPKQTKEGKLIDKDGLQQTSMLPIVPLEMVNLQLLFLFLYRAKKVVRR